MGRLFWKVFGVFSLVQVLAAGGFGFGVLFWQSDKWASMRGSNPSSLLPPPDIPSPLIPISLALFVSLGSAAILAWYFAKPIRTLRLAFGGIAGGRIDTRIGTAMGSRSDELADLGKDFDAMAERLQGVIESQRRLLHDVSHELRSPLARLHIAADLMQQQPLRGHEFADRIRRDTSRMDKLVGELLSVARMDAGMLDRPAVSVDLQEIISNVLDDAGLEADAKNCQIAVRVNGPILVWGDQEMLHRAIENVLRNAIRFSPEGSVIEMSGRACDRSVAIRVADRGPGVAANDLGAIFGPFVRSGTERDNKSFGLGLAITRRVVDAHGGVVKASNRDGGGLVVELVLPMFAQESDGEDR
jgi:signal transduction histidine kinase